MKNKRFSFRAKGRALCSLILVPVFFTLLLLSACGSPAAPAPELPTPEPTERPKADLPPELIGEWTLCIGDGAPGDGSEIFSFSIDEYGDFLCCGEVREGHLFDTEEKDILNYVTNDRHYLLRSVEKGGLALFYYDEESKVYTAASQQIFYKDFLTAELNTENWQDFFEIKPVYEIVKNKMNLITALNVRLFLLPKDDISVLSVRDGKVTTEAKPTDYALIEFDADSLDYTLSEQPEKRLNEYGQERFQYAESGLTTQSEFHNFAMKLVHGWAANIYARNEGHYWEESNTISAAVETEFDVTISEISGTLFYRSDASE